MTIKVYNILLFLLCIQLQVFGQQDCHERIVEARNYLEEDELSAAQKILIALNEQGFEQEALCQADYALLQGEVSLYEGDYQKAIAFLKDAMRYYGKLNKQEGKVKSAYQLALTLIESEQAEAAIPYLDGAIEEQKALVQTNLLHEVLDVRAMLHSTKGEHSAAMKLLKAAAQHAGNGENKEIHSQLLNQISTNYQAQGQVDSAIFYYKELIAVKQMTEDEAGLLSDYSTLGGLYHELGSYEAAQTAFIEATKYAERLRDTFSQITISIEIANIYLEQRLLAPALKYSEQARTLSKAKKMLLSEGQSLATQGAIFEYSKNVPKALQQYQSAFTIYEQLGLKQEMADTQVKIANLEGGKNNLQKAENSLLQALETRLAAGDKTGELNTKLALCDVLLKLKKEQNTIQNWLSDAEKIAKETNNTSGLQTVYHLQSRYYEQRGDYKTALQSYRAFNSVQDSILNTENAKIVQELEKRYESEKKDKALIAQEVEIERQENALRERNTRITQLLFGILALIAISALIFIAYQRKQQLNKQRLAVLEKERETQVLRAMVAGEEQERRRIARDLHDSLGALLASTKMRVNALGEQLPELKALDSYLKAEELIDDACKNVREVSHNMMPGALTKYGLERAIANICDAIETSNTIDAVFIPYGLEELEDENLEMNVHSIVQELLKNVVEHAAASEVIVQLTLDDNILNITIEDNGKGFDPKSHISGIGLGSVKTRVAHLNGTIDIDSSVGQGSTFMIDIPI